MGVSTRSLKEAVRQAKEDDYDMRRLAGGEQEALRDLMHRHGESVLNFLYHMTGDRTGSEDLTQETFLRVFRNADAYEPGRGVRPWVFTIARNLALNHHRRKRMEMRNRPNPAVRRNGDPELQARIRDTIEAIDEPFRSALVLCVLEGLSYEDAATVCECSIKTISSRLARARARFRDLMKPYLQDGKDEL